MYSIIYFFCIPTYCQTNCLKFTKMYSIHFFEKKNWKKKHYYLMKIRKTRILPNIVLRFQLNAHVILLIYFYILLDYNTLICVGSLSASGQVHTVFF